jgi:hypothetical protein
MLTFGGINEFHSARSIVVISILPLKNLGRSRDDPFAVVIHDVEGYGALACTNSAHKEHDIMVVQSFKGFVHNVFLSFPVGINKWGKKSAVSSR